MERLDILKWLIPAGATGSALTWWVGRRKRNFDMLKEMQNSVDMLVKTNNAMLAENIKLREENSELKLQVKELTRMVTSLKTKIDNLSK